MINQKKDKIVIRGARVHNLKNVNLELPKNKLVVITGLSGSGKSSLAFDTIYAEGQRRYAESLSAYARQFMEVRDKPDIDGIDGLSPTIAIDQKISTQNPRSTVGTVTEIYDYLRLLFARSGEQYCSDCGVKVESFTAGEIMENVRKLARKGEVSVFAPLIRGGAVEPRVLLDKVERSGYEWVNIDGSLIKINDLLQHNFKSGRNYDVSVLIGKISDIKKQDPAKLVDTALELGNGLILVWLGKQELIFSIAGLCPKCRRVMPELDIRSFSFNSPYGACPRCTGLGVTMEVDTDLVIPNPRLTLSEGAIQPWTRITGNQSWYQKLLAIVAARQNFSIDTPVADLPAKIKDLILKGTGEELYEVEGKKVKFSGVVKDLTERHLETTSDYVRKEIEQYMREKVCS
ncbi:MAG: Excinuclease ABC subunit A, partial [Candidatus Magasanikbacteria bacterium GW2011_GWA2_37_8]